MPEEIVAPVVAAAKAFFFCRTFSRPWVTNAVLSDGKVCISILEDPTDEVGSELGGQMPLVWMPALSAAAEGAVVRFVSLKAVSRP